MALLVATAAQLAVPQFVQTIVDAIVAGALNRSLLELPQALQQTAAQRLGLDLAGARTALEGAPNALVTAGIVVVLFAFARGLFTFAQNFWSQALSQEIAFGLRNDLFAKIQRLSFSYHDRNRTGQLMVRATDDVERLRGFIGQGLLIALQALILLVGTLVVLFATNVPLTLVVLPVLPLAMVVFMAFGAIAQPLFREVQKRLSQVNTVLQENLAGLRVVKAYAGEARERRRFEASNDAELEQRIRISRLFSFLFPFIFLVANLGQAAILYFGGRQIVAGTFTLGEWQKFSLYLTFLFLPLGQLGFIISLMAQAAASAGRIFEILDAKNEVENAPGAVELTQLRGEVEFRDVTFRYFGGGEAVLNQVSFRIEPDRDGSGPRGAATGSRAGEDRRSARTPYRCFTPLSARAGTPAPSGRGPTHHRPGCGPRHRARSPR